MAKPPPDLSEELAIELLLGKPSGDPDGWYPKLEYPKSGSKREKKAREALADALRKEAPGGYFVRLVAAMIDPRNKSKIIKRKISFKGYQGRKGERRTSDRRDIQIVSFIQEWRENHPDQKNLEEATAAAEKHFGFGDRTILKAWSRIQKNKI